MKPDLKLATVNRYLAHKQHLLPGSHTADVRQVTRDIVALHATDPTSPYLSLWARMPGFRREMLENALYENRELVKVLCMRVTLHVVPSDNVSLFQRAFQHTIEKRDPVAYRGPALLSQAGLCPPEEAGELQKKLQHQVLKLVRESGPTTVQEITTAVPELTVKIRHDMGKPYEGEFSVGSRFVPRMCTQGLLVRARPRGTWRSNLYEYTVWADWLPEVDLTAVTPEEARARVIRRYLAAFGPATLDDAQWWTGFTKTDVKKVLKALDTEVVNVALQGLGDGYLMLADDARRLRNFTPSDNPYVFFLPTLDPYIMGYRDRRRFLEPAHQAKLFDRAGNAVPTVWGDGRLVGAWGQREDGTVVYKLFEPVDEGTRVLLEERRQKLEDFLGGEYLAPRYRTSFTRAMS